MRRLCRGSSRSYPGRPARRAVPRGTASRRETDGMIGQESAEVVVRVGICRALTGSGKRAADTPRMDSPHGRAERKDGRRADPQGSVDAERLSCPLSGTVIGQPAGQSEGRRGRGPFFAVAETSPAGLAGNKPATNQSGIPASVGESF